MRKLVSLIMAVESDDETNVADEFIKWDLKNKIRCCCNFYELVSFATSEIANGTYKGETI